MAAAPGIGPFLALLLTMAFFSLKSDRFLQAQNLSLVMQQVMVVGVLAIGQTLVILTAGIDLSCGTVMALGQIVMTKLAVANGVPALPAIALGILTCVGFVLMLVLYAVAWFALSQTAWGRHVYAVGDDREAARL